jgi:hypothetical protein
MTRSQIGCRMKLQLGLLPEDQQGLSDPQLSSSIEELNDPEKAPNA